MDLNALFGKAKEAVNAGMNDLWQQGGTAALGFLEQKAIDVIAQDKAQKEVLVQKYVQQNLQGPPSPGSFGSYLGNLVQTPIIKEYGSVMLIGVGVIAFAAILLARKS